MSNFPVQGRPISDRRRFQKRVADHTVFEMTVGKANTPYPFNYFRLISHLLPWGCDR